jgi:hypothetical protein
MPCRLPKADVNIYHPHGFLPLQSKFAKFRNPQLVFSERSYQKAGRDDGSRFNEVQRHLFGTSIGLFIGMSGEDPRVDDIFSHVYDLMGRRELMAFMVLPDSRAARRNQDHLLARGVVPIYLGSHNDLPPLLLEICQRAADLL